MVVSGMDHLLLFICRRVGLREFADEAQDIVVRGDVAAASAVELDRAGAIKRKANVIDHLAGTHFDDGKDGRMHGGAAEVGCREGVKRDGAEDAYGKAFGAGFSGDGLEDASDDAVAD